MITLQHVHVRRTSVHIEFIMRILHVHMYESLVRSHFGQNDMIHSRPLSARVRKSAQF